MDGDWTGAIERARGYAPFLARLLDNWPEISELLSQGRGDDALALAKTAGEDVTDAGIALRREKQAIALVLGVGDLAGAFRLERVMCELSDFADRALDMAITAAIAKRMPSAEAAGMTALALGKHGGRELNYSSDIDPILLYDPPALPRRERDGPGEAAQRYAREIVRLLSDNTADGYVFRVDLRLRPQSEVSPLALSFDAALTHYESSALAWERAAFIRARAAAGDVPAGQDFLDAIAPFVWRRSLDFGAIDEVRRLTHRIREQQSGPRDPSPGWNVKLGRGGIREIEFFAQTHQLIHGGRDPGLRSADTREALAALAAAGRIGADTASELAVSYAGLREVEHRLQMVNDRQTHILPDSERMENAARLAGFANGSAWLDHIRQLSAPVARVFDDLISEDANARKTAPAVEDPSFSMLAERVRGWADGRYHAIRSDAARSAFAALREELTASLLDAPDPETAAMRFETFLDKLPSAVNLFRLLEARPALLDQLVRVLTLAQPLADALARRTDLLDPLIDRRALALPGTVQDLMDRMLRRRRDDTYEGWLDAIRIVTGEQRFALGVQLIEAEHDPLDIAAGLSRLAVAGLNVGLEAASQEFAETHGWVPDSELVIMALGRLGGGSLTHASDLDIVYLFTGSSTVESNGRRPLGATSYYNRLAQRVSAALSVPTAEGALYEVDTRLRPQGAQGPLAVSVESFARYQRESAWTWEHMALTRARVVAASDAAREQVEHLVRDVLSQPREQANLRQDVLDMRSEMAMHKTPRGRLDVKLLRGGLVDCEFIAHYLQLRDGRALEPDLVNALQDLANTGAIDPALPNAWTFMNRLLIAARLLAPGLDTPPPSAAERLATACHKDDYDRLLDRFADARRVVAGQWRCTFGEKLEIDNE